MFAVIELGGKQYTVRERDVLRVEKIDAPKDTSSTDKVLLYSDGKTTKIGTPYVTGAKAEFKVLKSGLSDKVRIFKMKAKKRYKRLRGHRQPYSEVEITKLGTLHA